MLSHMYVHRNMPIHLKVNLRGIFILLKSKPCILELNLFKHWDFVPTEYVCGLRAQANPIQTQKRLLDFFFFFSKQTFAIHISFPFFSLFFMWNRMTACLYGCASACSADNCSPPIGARIRHRTQLKRFSLRSVWRMLCRWVECWIVEGSCRLVC